MTLQDNIYLNTPIGYKAVPNAPNSYGCEFCSFSSTESIFCSINSDTSDGNHGACSAEFRKDGIDVHFIKD